MVASLKRLYRFLVRSQEEGLRTHEAVLSLLGHIDQAGSLLDVGCGDGSRTLLYAQKVGVVADHVLGIEQDVQYVEQAQERFPVARVDLEREPFPFADHAVDVIVCNQVLEHLKNIFLPLREMARVVTVGGHLLIGIPNLAAIQNRLLLLVGRQPMCNVIVGPHVRCFTTNDFAEFLQRNKDFELVAVTGATLYPFPYPMVKYGAAYFPALSSYAFYLLKKVRHSPVHRGWEEPTADTLF
ncbi:MAG: class I SAM-dependent methyltransferase [Nitrospirae bacterium]|nr:class I SAM-dependent methyltransferase [Nitrospirota bacterium]